MYSCEALEKIREIMQSWDDGILNSREALFKIEDVIEEYRKQVNLPR